MLRGLFRTRNLDDILKDIGGPQFALKRTLGAFNVTLIIGLLLILGGLVLGIVESVAVAKTTAPDNNSKGEGEA